MRYRPTELVLRCYAERVEGQWQAFCVDLTLAAQADTLEEAKRKLHDQITDYVSEATTVDVAHAYDLLHRRAALADVSKFYLYGALQKLAKYLDRERAPESRKAFWDAPGFVPASCAA